MDRLSAAGGEVDEHRIEDNGGDAHRCGRARPAGGLGAGFREDDVHIRDAEPDLAAYWDDIIAKTSATVPGVTIEKLVAPTTDRDAYARQLDSTGQLPDIMIAVNPTGLAEVGKLAEFSADELKDWVNPPRTASTAKSTSFRQYADHSHGLLSACGLPESGDRHSPKTWAELLTDAESSRPPASRRSISAAAAPTPGPTCTC